MSEKSKKFIEEPRSIIYVNAINQIYDAKVSLLPIYYNLFEIYDDSFVKLYEKHKKSGLFEEYDYLFDTDFPIPERFSGFPELEKHYSSHTSYSQFRIYHMLEELSFYRLSRKLSNEKLRNIELDCCLGATELYKTAYLWLNDFTCEVLPEATEKYQLRHADKNILFKGDTMTSVFTPIKEYIKLKYGIASTLTPLDKCAKPTDDWELYWLENRYMIHLSDFANEFIYWGYSCANFLPVPQGFNAGRSNFGKWDSWDLTLNQIYQWYLDNPQMSHQTNDSTLEELFKYAQNTKDTIFYCTEWLKLFHSWENFVEQNYMQSFILPDGHPKKFFQNHTLEYGLPKTLEEYEEFFKNAVSCIKERGDSINKYLTDSRTEKHGTPIQ